MRRSLMIGISMILIAAAATATFLVLDIVDGQTPLDLKALSGAQVQELRDKFYDLEMSGVYVDYARLHGDDGLHCPHEKPEFLAWHRAYLIAFENALGAMVPYWDWTETYRLRVFDQPTYRGGRRNSLYNGFMFDSERGGVTGEFSTRKWTNLDESYLADYTYRALTRNTFTDFQRELEAVHATVHNGIGGAMVPVKTAAFDPIFWFHHSFVNVVWSMWTALHPNRDMQGLENLSITDYDLRGSRTTIISAQRAGVKFPRNQVFRRAERSLQGRRFGPNEANDTNQEDPMQTQHLILSLHNVTSPMASEKIIVNFQGKTAGYYGFIGMSHRMKRACHDRFIDLTRGYYTLVSGKNLDEVEKLMNIEIEDCMTKERRPYTGGSWDLNWEIY